MTYFNINYNALKQYIMDHKEDYNAVDIAFLLEHGFINQQQYQDLMTVIVVPMYDYKNFYQKDNGYYRQQGPLNRTQIMNDIVASKKNRLLKKIIEG